MSEEKEKINKKYRFSLKEFFSLKKALEAQQTGTAFGMKNLRNAGGVAGLAWKSLSL